MASPDIKTKQRAREMVDVISRLIKSHVRLAQNDDDRNEVYIERDIEHNEDALAALFAEAIGDA